MYLSQGTQSTLLVPVQFGKRLYGALGCDYCREKHVWRPDEIRLLEAVARQLELALDNLHLFEEVRLRADELAAALTRLEELDRLKDKFIQNVSHELRSPLAIVHGYVEMLQAGELGELQPEQKKPVAIIARRVRMLSDLVQDITLILEAEVSPPTSEAVRLDELAQVAVEDFQLAAEQAELTLCVEIAPELPPVAGSPNYMRRALDNLLGNAIKFTSAGGTITVRVRRQEEQVLLEVSDTGVGIPPDQLERVFERFYQVDRSIWQRYGGMGLGLALVKETVETYGGHVTVESQVGEGSTFTVMLPIITNSDFENAEL
jgi:signal transduction histidine kinase